MKPPTLEQLRAGMARVCSAVEHAKQLIAPEYPIPAGAVCEECRSKPATVAHGPDYFLCTNCDVTLRAW